MSRARCTYSDLQGDYWDPWGHLLGHASWGLGTKEASDVPRLCTKKWPPSRCQMVQKDSREKVTRPQSQLAVGIWLGRGCLCDHGSWGLMVPQCPVEPWGFGNDVGGASAGARVPTWLGPPACHPLLLWARLGLRHSCLRAWGSTSPEKAEVGGPVRAAEGPGPPLRVPPSLPMQQPRVCSTRRQMESR